MQLTEPQDIINYVLGGRATFTLESAVTGAHFTYKTSTPAQEKLQGCRFVGYLAGPDNEHDFQYLGMVAAEGDGLRFWTTRGSPKRGDALKAFEWFTRHLTSEQIRFLHSGKCCRCGRKLTTPESIASGIGPVCANRES